MEHHRRESTACLFTKKSPNTIRRLTTCQILGKLSSKTRKMWDSWKEKSNMSSICNSKKIIPNFQREEPVYIGARQGHSREPGHVNVSRRKIEKGYATLLYHIGFSKDEDSLEYGGLLPGGFGISRCRKESAFFHSCRQSIRTPTRTDLETAQTSLEFLPHDERQCLVCYDTVPSKFLTQIINLKDGSEKFGKEDKEEESSPTKRSRRDQGQPSETSGHNINKKHLNLDSWKMSLAQRRSLKKNRSSDVYVQCNDCSLQMWIGGLTGLQEKSA